MSQRTFFVGDIHGRSDLLLEMLDFIEATASGFSSDPQVIFLGDIVDRGIDSCGSMEAVHETLVRWPASRLVISNHDDMFLDVIEGRMSEAKQKFWLDRCGGWQTCASYDPSGELNAAMEAIRSRFPHHVKMLRQASPLLRVGEFVACHAGINGWLPIDEQDRHDLMWITDGFLDRVDDSMPPVVHGHTPMGDLPVVTENRISIDTGAHDTGRLTAFFVDRVDQKYDFYQTSPAGPVQSVAPLVHNRGRGSLLDRMAKLLAT